MATRVQIQYEMEACPRCKGSGEYAYHYLHGTKCFRCNGAQRIRTANGRRAAKVVDAMRADGAGWVATGERVKSFKGATVTMVEV